MSRTKQQLLGTGDQLSGTGYGKPGTEELGGTGLGVWRVADWAGSDLDWRLGNGLGRTKI